jgi:hypothetical protein
MSFEQLSSQTIRLIFVCVVGLFFACLVLALLLWVL